MTLLSYYIDIGAPVGAKARLQDFFHERYLKTAQNIPGIIAIRAFMPSAGEVPFFDDDGSPQLSVQLLLASPEGLTASLANGSLADFCEISGINATISHQLFELIEQDLPNTSKIAYGKAKQSFAVRYYSKDCVENEDKFRSAYLKGHPDALANFPAVRRIFCYVPVTWDDPTDIHHSSAIIGNEVVFDTIEALRTAFLSPAMSIAGKHSRTLPRFKGWNTHFPMTLIHEWLAP